jgi:hypothetical protein
MGRNKMFTLADVNWKPCLAGVNEMGGFTLLGSDEALDLGNGTVVQGPGDVYLWRWYIGTVVHQIVLPGDERWEPEA